MGDYVEILQDNDPAVCEGLHDYMVRAIGQTLKVVAKDGRTLTVNRPLYFSYNPKARGWVNKWEMFDLTRDVLGLVADLARNGYLDQRGFILDKFVALRACRNGAGGRLRCSKEGDLRHFVCQYSQHQAVSAIPDCRRRD